MYNNHVLWLKGIPGTVVAHDTIKWECSSLSFYSIVVIVTVYSQTGNIGGYRSEVTGCNNCHLLS